MELSEEDLRREKKQKRLARLVFWFARCVQSTLRFKRLNLERLQHAEKGAIFVTWHGRSFIPAGEFKDKGYWALVSLSKDGALQSKIFTHFGFQIIRGSTGRGGVKGALQMARKLREGEVLAFTPDGPRGPSHKVQPGVIMMAQKSGAPIIPLGVSAAWRLEFNKSWDSYMVPLPFSRAYFLVGEPFYVPTTMSDTERDLITSQLEIAMNQMEREAELLAGRTNYGWPVTVQEATL